MRWFKYLDLHGCFTGGDRRDSRSESRFESEGDGAAADEQSHVGLESKGTYSQVEFGENALVLIT